LENSLEVSNFFEYLIPTNLCRPIREGRVLKWRANIISSPSCNSCVRGMLYRRSCLLSPLEAARSYWQLAEGGRHPATHDINSVHLYLSGKDPSDK